MAIYIFGRSAQRTYSQYIDDGTREVFQTMVRHLRNAALFATHRDGQVMYYCYMIRLDGGGYLGLALLKNGICYKDMNVLQKCFQQAMGILLFNGEHVSLKKGTLRFHDFTAQTHAKVSKEVLGDVEKVFENTDLQSQPLPVQDMANDKDHVTYASAGEIYQPEKYRYTYTTVGVSKELISRREPERSELSDEWFLLAVVAIFMLLVFLFAVFS